MAVAFTGLEPFGVEITGASGGRLVDRRAADECRAALDEHGVVIYRELGIGDDDLVAFTRLLGEPVVAKTSEHRHPEIDTITLDPAKTNAALAAVRRGNFHWHIDGATIDVPQQATLLTAREVDPAGGDTEFANTFLAYQALPEKEKAELDGLRVVHSFAAAQLRANPEASERERAVWERVSPKVHPLVWTRQNGRRSLLVGATAGEVVGRPPEEGRALLDRLTEWATQPRFVLRHRWRRGDLVIWDNTGMLHRAMPFEPTSLRLMHRTTLVGEEAVA
ncbi:TauD/TfdA dioxygenase family protein [Actinomadura rugatobispora]|uniref:TauD/TfdA dioxygenase family protein n=1 Tax=Actinomadura rugatobispora TaxID=1994 RepID=A0ABW1AEG2_9ACTN|nr:TauD/TfdA family dioxygenase [Actinomadura rugatobispora]